MSEVRLNLPRSIFGQGTIILLPILVLVGLGFYVLKRDEAAVTEEARQRAGDVVRDLSDRLGRQIATELSHLGEVGNLWAGDGIVAGRVHWPGHSPLTSENLATYQNALTDLQANYPDVRPEEVFPIYASFTDTGAIASPPDYPIPPTPGRWLVELSAEQRSLWREATDRQAASSETNAVRSVFQELLDSNPPPPAKANIEFALLQLDLKAAAREERPQQLIRFSERHGGYLSESGLPLCAVALGRALQEAGAVGLTEDLFDALNTQAFGVNPSFLSPRLLAEEERLAARHSPAARQAMVEVRLRWESQERLRGLARRVQRILQPTKILTTNLWFDFAGERWFAILNPGESQPVTSTNGQFLTFTNRITQMRFFPERAVRRAAELALSRITPSSGGYFGTELSLEGERLLSSKIANSPPLLLAHGEGHLLLPGAPLLSDRAATEPRSGDESETLPSHPRFAVGIYLAHPDLLYAFARQRARIFGALILAAAGLAVLGLVRTLQTLVRQQRLNEMKSNFVSSVSHELRAPIASVRLMAEGLESGRVKDEQKRQEYFTFIVQECRRLASLVENVLDFSRIEEGRKEYEFEPVDAAALVEQTLKLKQTYAAEKNVRLVLAASIGSLRLSACPLQLLADGRALQQALANLIDNAIKHSPVESTVTVGLDVAVETAHETDAKISSSLAASHGLRSSSSTLHLWVEDQGEGIPPQEHELIFERFYRRGSELRRETQGVGIGLSIVKHIVEAHGGRVLVRSAVGEGSRFTIELPLKQLGEP